MATRFNLIVTTARNLQTILLISVAVIAGIAWAVAVIEPPLWVWITVAVILGFGLGIIISIIFARLAGRSKTADGGFVVTSYEMIYAISPENYRAHSCIRRLKLKATKNNARLFTFNYNWSGQGSLGSRVTSRGHQLLGEVGLSQPERCLIFYVGSHDRGDEVDFEFTQDLEDEAGLFHHFIAKVIKVGLKSIKLTINLPRNIDFEPEFTGVIERFNNDSTWVRIKTLTPEITRTGDSWTVEVDRRRPRVGRVVLRWSWEGVY